MTELPNWIAVNDIVRGSISNITDSGERHIGFRNKNAYINLGRHLTADIGDVVEARILNSRSEGDDLQARCLTEDAISDDSFTPNDGQKWGTTKKEIPSFVADLFSRGGGPNDYAHFCMEIDRISSNGNPVANAPGFSEQVLLRENADSITAGTLALVKISRSEIMSLPQAEFIKIIPNEDIQTLDLTNTNGDYIPAHVNPEEELNEPSHTGKTKESSQSKIDTRDLEKLRKHAKQEEAVSVSNSSKKGSESITEYSRSDAVRKYVMARADGICEGCGDSAPFVDDSGDPFLHAHHIYELSNGGQDTIDTVAALCPNCHYRVHHGKDGDKFNEGILRAIQSKETN